MDFNTEKGGKNTKAAKKDEDQSGKKSASSRKGGKKGKEKEAVEINEEDYIPIEKKAEIGMTVPTLMSEAFTNTNTDLVIMYAGHCTLLKHQVGSALVHLLTSS